MTHITQSTAYSRTDGYMKKEKKGRYHVLFALYLALLIYFLFFAESFRESTPDYYRYNLIQLITRVGCCDVDDVILNTLGGMLGYLCYWIWRKYKHESEK